MRIWERESKFFSGDLSCCVWLQALWVRSQHVEACGISWGFTFCYQTAVKPRGNSDHPEGRMTVLRKR